MKNVKMFFGLCLVVFAVSNIVFGQSAGDFRTHQTGAWENDTTWEKYNGSTWVWPAAAIPDTLHATTIRTGHVVTVAGNDTVGNSTVDAGGQVTVISTPASLYVANGTMTVNGTLVQTGTAAVASPYSFNRTSTGFYIIANSGVFQQDQNQGQIPISTWNDGSTILISGVTTGTNMGGNARQSYYNIVWNCPNQTANANLGINPAASGDTSITIRGNITALSTGLARMYVCGPPAGTAVAHTVVRATINGNLTVLNGSIVSAHGTSSNYTDILVTVLGNISVRDSIFLPSSVYQWSQLSISRGSQGGTGTTTWFIKSDSVTYGRKTTNSNSTDANTAITSKGKFVFCKPGTQYVTLDDSVGWTGPCNMQFGDSVTATTINIGNSPFIGSGCLQRIKYNATVIAGPNGYIGGGNNSTPLPSNFAIDNGATLVTASPNGIRATGGGSSGTVRVTGNRDYGTAANFEYTGSVHQRLGSGLPGSANNLTINNPLNVYVDSVAAFTVNGTLAVNNGDLELNGSIITLGPSGQLSETAGNTVTGPSGVITTTRTLTSPSSSTDIAGLGVSIGSSANLGSTVITRGHAVQAGASSGSITRYFDITPTTNTGLNATLVFRYDESELNAISEASLGLFKSTDSGTSWTSAGGTVNAPANTVTLSGINDLSRWTAATGSTSTTLNVAIAAGWNLISNPVTNPIPGDSVRQMYPTSLNAYAFEFSGGYVQRYKLANGKGYWEKFPGAIAAPVTGTLRTRDSVSVVGGWNIVGSISNTVDTNTIVSVPAGLRASNWFGYTAGYTAVTQLVPGKGYWVKSTGVGKFVLANPLARPSSAQGSGVEISEVLNTLTITDSKGGSQTLYFGADGQKQIPVAMYAMPPAPPVGAFDARFETADGGSMVQTHGAELTTPVEFAVSVQSDAYPLTITWKVAHASYAISAAGSSKDMTGEGSMKIANSSVNRFSVKLTGDSQLPKEFALSQNYPNPFNPTTSIKYALPVDSKVTMEIYNVVGQRVRTLVNDNQAAGYHAAEWNGVGNSGQQLSSGVYFLHLSAQGVNGASFNEIRKLMMLK